MKAAAENSKRTLDAIFAIGRRIGRTNEKGPRLWRRAGAIGLGPTCSGEAQGGAPTAHRQSLEIANFLLDDRFAGTKIMLFKRGEIAMPDGIESTSVRAWRRVSAK
ncbi:hypothetical protein CIT31_31820 [Mesorhizobium wenxiniae]|uniref:Uncharacterized protein n=1 Tax=Mesorhizobium wenxiniae TaxID=2014805 RepID=A0A271K9U8_9HYPH|nr:hypothetical protein CIT31_31820 [Mesorhizobium wenxiniae]